MQTEADKKTKHYSYKDIVEMMAKSSWGREFSTDDEAQRHLLSSVGISEACVLALFVDAKNVISFLSNVVTNIVDAAVELKLESYSGKMIDRHERQLAHFAKDRGVEVGDIPESIQDYFWNMITSEVGESACEGFLDSSPGPYLYCAPSKKSAVHQEYKKWMASLRKKKRQATGEAR